MKNQITSDYIEREKIIFHLKKCHQIILNLFSFVKVTPVMVQPKKLIQYVHSLQQMLSSFFEFLPKKCVHLHYYKKNEQQLQEKSNKINQLLQNQKKFKIEVKVLEQKVFQLQKKHAQKKVQRSLIQHFRAAQTAKSVSNIKQKIEQQQQNLYSKFHKKRLSLPHLSSQRLMKTSKKKKFSFIDHPGNGNQILIQHLINKKL